MGIGGLPIIYPGNSSLTGYSLRANIGYAPSEEFTIGILPFAGKVQDTKSVGASLYSRFYLQENRFSFFIEAGLGFGKLTYDNTPQFNGTLFTYNVGPGMHYLLNPTSKNRLAFEFLIQYARLQNITYSDNTVLGNTLIPTLGIQYFINK